MKVLWFSNCRLDNDNMNGSGTWLKTMSDGLLKNDIQLFVITQDYIDEIEEVACNNGLHQWVLPIYKLTNNGLPEKKNIEKIQSIVSIVSPDIIQVWGMESYWGLLTARGYVKGKIILEIQGILGSCADVYYGGLNPISFARHLSFRDIRSIKRLSVFIKRDYEKRFKYEKEMLRGHSIISTQSDWVRAWVAPDVLPSCHIINTGIIVRKEFLIQDPWEYNGSHRIFVMMSTLIPYKGLHNVIDAFRIVKSAYSDAELVVAGRIDINAHFCSMPEYVSYIRNKIRKLNLLDSVLFTGPLNADGLIFAMKNCSVMLHSSYVESYSLALAESMCIGIPSVVSFAGAMPELATDDESALFFSPGDFRRCASQIMRLFKSREKQTYISKNAIKQSRSRNNEESVIELQLKIYNNI